MTVFRKHQSTCSLKISSELSKIFKKPKTITDFEQNMLDWCCRFCLLRARRNIVSDNKFFLKIFQQAKVAKFEQIFSGTVVATAISMSRIWFQEQEKLWKSAKPFNFSKFEQTLLDWCSALFACSVQMRTLSNLFWKLSDYYAFCRKLG